MKTNWPLAEELAETFLSTGASQAERAFKLTLLNMPEGTPLPPAAQYPLTIRLLRQLTT